MRIDIISTRSHRLCTCVLLLLMPYIVTSQDVHPPDTLQEVCQTEQFRAQCEEGHVISVTTATYGRMRVARCVKRNLGYLPCASDVTGVLHARCSGRRTCAVRVPDPELEATRPCVEELKAYLEVSYSCISVVEPLNACDHTPIRITRPEGMLSSHVALTSGCGLDSSPWLIQADPGQRINVTLYDFGYDTHRDRNTYPHSQPDCTELAFLTDRMSGRKLKLCPRSERVTHVYTSLNNTLDVTMRSHAVLPDAPGFLVHYQFIGCPDMTPPLDMHFRRTSALTATLTCMTSPQSYDLLCDVTTWRGHWRNCTQVEPMQGVGGGQSFTEGIVLMCVVAVSVVILVLLTATVVICMRRIQRRPRHFYRYDTGTYYSPTAQQENRANLKQLHIESKDLEMQDQELYYRPVHRVPSQAAANNQGQGDCHMCQGQTYERLPVADKRLYAAQQNVKTNPRLANNYAYKDSNIRNDLSTHKQKSNTFHGHGKKKKQNGVHQKCECPLVECTCTKRDDVKPLNKSCDCDMMLDGTNDVIYDMKDKIYSPPIGHTAVTQSLLNNTL